MKNEKLFQTICASTAIIVFLLFFLGGLVRSTGSGMGCPDWPTCFGKIVPPMNAEELPEGYEAEFLKQRIIKINRLVKLLNVIGLTEKAELLESNKHILESHPYNKAKMLTEYVNRILGVLSGFFSIATLLLAFQFYKTNRKKFILAFLGFIGILVNGILGSIVVQTNLLEGMVSIHFIAALITFCLFILAWFQGTKGNRSLSSLRGKKIATILLIITGIQVVTGILSRESIDVMHRLGTILSIENMHELGSRFFIHRFLVLAIILVLVRLFINNKKENRILSKWKLPILLSGLVAIQVVTGTVNLTSNFPAFSQVIHITLGSGTFILAFILYLQERNNLSAVHHG